MRAKNVVTSTSSFYCVSLSSAHGYHYLNFKGPSYIDQLSSAQTHCDEKEICFFLNSPLGFIAKLQLCCATYLYEQPSNIPLLG